ncbi:Vgb family protein [Larkinella soli]|uniref:Vgb family protein n=1 Tax=Larkinella soli TaxID=1770527 RepID=UPI000FFB3DC5|nr:SMP-30/gluconolactonase/LRE family protein [Larkinella soli]
MNRILSSVLLLAALCNACTLDDHVDGIEVRQASYTLPGNTFFPEGIAYDPKQGVFYTGSVANGDIVKVDVQTGAGSLFAPGAAQGRTAATGLKLDAKGRLWVCGGATNKIYVLNPDGSLLKSWDLASFSPTGFINDCILDENYVYFTDSQNQQIYRTDVAASTPGDIERWLTFTNAQIPYTSPGVNANGIELTPDSKYLILVVSSSGKLYRIDTASKAISEITLNTPVNSGDGLWLENNILYVSRNATNLIFPVTLSNDYLNGTVGAGFGENLLFNTTLAKAGNYFLVVNGQLNRRSGPTPPVLPFTVSRVAIP